MATVSGVSSGAYFAVQFHVAHSAIVNGAAAVAGGPYYCAQGSIKTAYYNCMTPSRLAPLPSTAVIRRETEDLARAGRIDPTSNLGTARAWLFTGSNDQTVTRDVVEGLHAFYASYNTRTVIVRDTPAGHAMVTEDAGNKDCAASKPPFINDCDYDAAGELLKHLLGNLAPPPAKPGGRLARFDQAAFGGHDISMDDEGFVYIPKVCESQRCRVHVAFHGCRQGREAIKDQFAREAGYNRWADSNRVIVLYPQVITRSWPTYNPNGCWDWWGYTGAQYHTKEGAQIRAVKGMLERLSAPKR
ncbi:MAG TPA: PHB depolymerase family esterase [Burkholderiales bacterium]|nr:PHB depolymerase family esterase [Burkholderiales bacterium]